MFRMSAKVVFDFRHARQFLTHDASVYVVNAVISQLDFYNSLL